MFMVSDEFVTTAQRPEEQFSIVTVPSVNRYPAQGTVHLTSYICEGGTFLTSDVFRVGPCAVELC